MAKGDKRWIIVKTLNRSLGWNYSNGWDAVVFATVFYNQNYLLPFGGMWKEVPKVVATKSDTSDGYPWTEGDLITA